MVGVVFAVAMVMVIVAGSYFLGSTMGPSMRAESSSSAEPSHGKMRTRMRTRLFGLLAAGLFAVPVVCAAQNAPPRPSTTNPQSKQGGAIVANPTDDECKRGWNAGMRWTKEQFQEFCARLNASK
jgi:hypothetical protein